nr:HD domain-containing protein [Acetatifactor sp.]
MFYFIKTYQLDIMLALSAACATFALLLFFTKSITRRRRWILIFMEVVATALLFFDRMAYLYSGDMSHTGYIMVRLSNLLVFILTSAIVFGFNLYLVDLLAVEGNVTAIPKRLMFVGIAALLAMLLVVIAHYTGLYYYFDEQNVYHRGPGFLISYFIPVVGPLIQYTVIKQYRGAFSRLIYISLVLYIFVPIAVGVIQIFAYGISIVNMAMVLVSILLYIFTYLDINETVARVHQNEMVELEKEKKSMKRLFDQTATAFVTAVEKKDAYAQGHSKRVAQLARRMAVSLGKDAEECDKVYYAALLHDIGMIGIPDSVVEKTEELSVREAEIIKQKPQIGGEILSRITEYPYLREGAHYYKERYDGTGYPEGLKGEKIPEIARIIAVCDAYDNMTMKKRNHNPLPYQTVREEFVKQSGARFDPEMTEIMIRILDEENAIKMEAELAQVEKDLVCGRYKETVSTGVEVTEQITKIQFHVELSKEEQGVFSAPSILLFDSYDRHMHDNLKAIEAYRYIEYGEVWFDGHYVSTDARNMEVQCVQKRETPDSPDPRTVETAEERYLISAARYEDHMSIHMESPEGKMEIVVALPDRTKSAYIGITGENCHIKDITVQQTNERVGEGDIRKIADEVSFIDRMEADLENVQVDRHRSASTKGVLVEEELRIDFHTMSLPSANLVWHCPYLVLFYSNDGRIGGGDYREYVLIKLNGEMSGDDKFCENKFSMKKKDTFPGWEVWKEKNKEGMECCVRFLKKGNKITLNTENLGLAIENTTILKEGAREVYAALTGDQVALTDIRI